MARTATFKRQLTRKDFKQAKKAMFFYRNRYIFPVLLILFGIGVKALVDALQTGSPASFMTALILMLALPISFVFLYRKNVVERGNNEDFVPETVFTIDSSYITARVAGEEARQLMVTQLKKSIETRRFFFLFSDKKSAVILTKKDMSEEDVRFLKAILQKHIGRDARRFPV